MNKQLPIVRIFFGILSIIFITTYVVTNITTSILVKLLSGIFFGCIFNLLIITIEASIKKINLKFFNTMILGLLFGFIAGKTFYLIFDEIATICNISTTINHSIIDLIKIMVFLTGLYFGVILTIKFSDEVYFSIPFTKLTHSNNNKKKDVILDISVLNDNRLLDFCSSGILDNQLILPKFIISEIANSMLTSDDQIKLNLSKSIDIMNKLKSMPNLSLRYDETDFADIRDLHKKTVKLAIILDANILTTDFCKMDACAEELPLFINLNMLTNSLKPIITQGKSITLKIQRYGKEHRQGIGYLEDGTMVVVNNGGDHIGEIIETQVISIKQTSAGRIIFTNALIEQDACQQENSIINESHIYEHQHE